MLCSIVTYGVTFFQNVTHWKGSNFPYSQALLLCGMVTKRPSTKNKLSTSDSSDSSHKVIDKS